MSLEAQGHQVKAFRGLGAVVTDNGVFLLFEDPTQGERELHLAKSMNGLSFKTLPDHVNLQDYSPQNPVRLSDVRISLRDDEYYMTYKKEGTEGLTLSISSELMHWGTLATIPDIAEVGMIAPNYKKAGKYVMFYGDSTLNMATSSDLKAWKKDDHPVLTPSNFNWEQKTDVSLHIGTVVTMPQGLVIVYYLKVVTENDTTFALQAVMVDKLDPRKILWQSEVIWDNSEDWARNKVDPIGIVFYKGRLISYWNYQDRGVFSIQHASLTNLLERKPDNRELFLEELTPIR